MANNTIQSGIRQNRKDYSQFSYWLGGINVTQENLDDFTPYIQGVSRIFLYTPPFFMDKMYRTETKQFKSLVETGYTRIDGISDISVEFVDFEGGFNGDKFSTVSQAKDDTDTLTISAYEQTGRPIGEFLETWVTGTRDIRTGVAHYHSGIQQGTVEYGEKRHTAEFVYETLDPTALNPEYVCLFACSFPTKVPKSHLNYEKGTRDNALMDMEFRTKKYESVAINQVGVWYLKKSTVDYNYLDFNPHISQEQVNAAGTAYGSSYFKS